MNIKFDKFLLKLKIKITEINKLFAILKTKVKNHIHLLTSINLSSINRKLELCNYKLEFT